jgi:hypothetical protein
MIRTRAAKVVLSALAALALAGVVLGIGGASWLMPVPPVERHRPSWRPRTADELLADALGRPPQRLPDVKVSETDPPPLGPGARLSPEVMRWLAGAAEDAEADGPRRIFVVDIWCEW